jgi:DNA adenine methylase
MATAFDAKPIVKWAGGKSRLLPELLERVPRSIGTYAEPFAGGAALFFALASQVSRGERKMARAVLADQNEELIALYRAVQSHVDDLIDELGDADRYRADRDLFYRQRELDTSKLSIVERAARFMFLNRTCFNGLWRVNASGRFNVPFGKYKNPRICDPDGLRAANRAFNVVDVTIVHADFATAVARLGRRDFVYFDPPYVPLSRTASFTSYAKAGFGERDQERLAAVLRELRDHGVRAMLSNADTPVSRALYEGLTLDAVRAPRSISCDGATRNAVSELLVTTWSREQPLRRAG